MQNDPLTLLLLLIQSLVIGGQFHPVAMKIGDQDTSSYLHQITSLRVGNGLTIHPSESLVLYSKPAGAQDYYRIYQLKRKNGQWIGGVPVPFGSTTNDYHPVFSPDGKWVYFNSDRPVPRDSLPALKMNIWRVRYSSGKWGAAEYLTAINTENHESYPTLTADGSIYFNSDRPGGVGSMDIYKAKFENGDFLPPVNCTGLNSPDSENDLVISPDERFIIFNRYIFDHQEVDLFISKNSDGNWTFPEALDQINQKETWELTPTLSPDGNYFFCEVEGQLIVYHLKTIIQ